VFCVDAAYGSRGRCAVPRRSAGIGVALALHINPVFGAAAVLLSGALLVWLVESETSVSAEAFIGVLFSTALAVGSMMASGEELIEALFGRPGFLKWSEILFGFAASGAVIAFVISQRRKLVVMLVSPEVARTAGIAVRRLDPAKRLSRNLNGMLLSAVTVALVSTVAGASLAMWLKRETGPMIVIAAAACFLVALLRKSAL